MTDIELLVEAINQHAQAKLTDYVSLSIALASVLLSIVAIYFTKTQRDISQRAERLSIHTELLDILHYLKHYNGEIDEACEKNFRRLLKLKAISKSAYNSEAEGFIDTLIKRMHEMPVKRSAYLEKASEETIKILNAIGYDSNIQEALGVQYLQSKKYFQTDTFNEFKRLFPV